MNVLSLFDGMSCGQIALDRAGTHVDNYFASEIDKYAIAVTQHNYPNTKQLGDIANLTGDTLPEIDLLIGGSPCQGFSFAGKQLNFNDPRSILFFEYVRLLEECSPRYFLLENVKMKKQYKNIISNCLGVEPIELNSSLVSAQNRKRLYWTNIPISGTPEDKKIFLKDILEDGFVDKDKSYCIDANYFKGGNLKSYFEKHRRQLVFSKDGLCHVGDADIRGNDVVKRVYHPEGKAPTLTTMGGGHREPKILCGAMRGRYLVDGVRQDHKGSTAGKTKQYIEVRHNGKTNALTTVQKDNVVCFTDTNDVRHNPEDLMWRKLTPLECERLQTVPDNYTLVPYGNRMMSNTQRYKMLGNGWTIDIIVWIFEFLSSS